MSQSENMPSASGQDVGADGGRPIEDRLQTFIDYVLTDPCEQTVAMDCNDCCEYMSQLAEEVAAGRPLREIMPELAAHLHCYPCVREEFEVLTSILEAEQAGLLDQVEL